jgi:heme/copper-type cytochrome/quinol oxidase subunit 2
MRTITIHRPDPDVAMKRLLIAALFALPMMVLASEVPTYTLTIKNHRYEPTTLRVPADTKIKIKVVNKDSTPEEFESNDFNREKIVMPHGTITVFVGPLKAGEYKFFGDFHQDTAQGILIAE